MDEFSKWALQTTVFLASFYVGYHMTTIVLETLLRL